MNADEYLFKNLTADLRRFTQMKNGKAQSAKRIASGFLFQPFFNFQSSILDSHPSPLSPQHSLLSTTQRRLALCAMRFAVPPSVSICEDLRLVAFAALRSALSVLLLT